ncbi:hypothetical protein CPBF424_04940 [Xanthomonas euroxanthea]|uniref:Uncharacterized protein n=1 Tax=Xanthomonas euroxanthea TaxID=2259622 RepID=A0AA46C5H9_9XANT|nr:hypothetical protein CPBF424_04940 [Xanthomonas euroxanthea]
MTARAPDRVCVPRRPGDASIDASPATGAACAATEAGTAMRPSNDVLAVNAARRQPSKPGGSAPPFPPHSEDMP